LLITQKLRKNGGTPAKILMLYESLLFMIKNMEIEKESIA
jgi:hypothetical protein